MAILTSTRYWRDPQTGDVLKEEQFDDGTVTNPMPSGAGLATEQDYYVGRGTGESEIAGWVQSGLQAAGQG